MGVELRRPGPLHNDVRAGPPFRTTALSNPAYIRSHRSPLSASGLAPRIPGKIVRQTETERNTQYYQPRTRKIIRDYVDPIPTRWGRPPRRKLPAILPNPYVPVSVVGVPPEDESPESSSSFSTTPGDSWTTTTTSKEPSSASTTRTSSSSGTYTPPTIPPPFTFESSSTSGSGEGVPEPGGEGGNGGEGGSGVPIPWWQLIGAAGGLLTRRGEGQKGGEPEKEPDFVPDNGEPSGLYPDIPNVPAPPERAYLPRPYEPPPVHHIHNALNGQLIPNGSADENLVDELASDFEQWSEDGVRRSNSLHGRPDMEFGNNNNVPQRVPAVGPALFPEPPALPEPAHIGEQAMGWRGAVATAARRAAPLVRQGALSAAEIAALYGLRQVGRRLQEGPYGSSSPFGNIGRGA